jgi:IclR family acetate operon transcriptional repressor
MMSAGSASVNRALEILDFVGRVAPQGVQLKDLAQRLDLPESTAHRLLTSLGRGGYVRQREDRGPYTLGWKVVLLAQALGTESHLIKEIRPHLERLSHRLGRTVNLAVLNRSSVMYLDCQVPNDVVSLYTAPGSVFPAHATALGKAIMAYLPSPELEVTLSHLRLERLTQATITSLPRLRRALEEVAKDGYAVDRGELKRGVMCFAAPVLDSRDHALAAISVTAQASSLSDEDEEGIIPHLVATAQAASRHFASGSSVG